MIAYVVVGAILIWAIQTTPLLDFMRRRALTQELLNCKFCTGCWVYSGLAFLFPRSLYLLSDIHYVPVITEIATGIITSYVWYLIASGWEANHAVRS